MSRTRRRTIAALLIGLGAGTIANASELGLLPIRDQNPFVLGSGLPAAPLIPGAERWQLNATFTLANTELADTQDDASFVFDAETRETRIAAAYAFNTHWSIRATTSHVAIGDGVFDSSIEDFHRIFGLDNGDRGQLGTNAPAIEVRDDGALLYALHGRRSGIGPTLVDVTRAWRGNGADLTGISFGVKLPTGSESRLSDTGSTDLSMAAFAQRAFGDRWLMAGQAGVLHQLDNQLLGEDRARDWVPFASAMLSYRLGAKWGAIAQIDAHAGLYRDLPDFFGDAGTLTFGLTRRTGDHGRLHITLTEDVPALQTTDIALQVGWRYGSP